MKQRKNHVIILTPVYNDWQSFRILARQVNKVTERLGIADLITFIVINDSSSDEPDYSQLEHERIELVHLVKNVGHQKAIAIGLAYIAEEKECDQIIVMDADGEDRPEDIKILLAEHLHSPNKIIFAKRSGRREQIWFKGFYCMYKAIFKIFTGKNISFGNFSLVPYTLVTKVAHTSEIWNHYASGIIKSKIPYLTINIERGQRFTGKSHMAFNSLVIHGLSAISVQIDVVSVRILLATLCAMVLAIIGIVVTAGIRFFADIALPGWATYVVLSLVIVFMQAFLISLMLVFMTLHHRSQKLFIPARDYTDFILKVERLY